MKIDILTLFPKMFDGFLTESILKRAIDKKKVDINIHNIRDYSDDSHKKVDDEPYGGGSGMVLKCQPIFGAVKKIEKENTKVILLTPQGIPFNQKMAYNLSKEKHIIFVCGHYEGFDERIRSLSDLEISIGDYVLTGGEIPSMVITDAVVRLLDDVIEEESHEKDSFTDGLLDYPAYTKPRVYEDLEVPEVLLSGNHKEIDDWREDQKIIRTTERRPDLLDKGKYKLYKNNNLKIKDMKELTGFTFNPKNNAKRTDLITVTNMDLMSPKFVKRVVDKNIEKKILQLLKKSIMFFEEDSSSDNAMLVLDEAERLKAILKNYEKLIEKGYKEEIEAKINLLTNEIKMELMSKTYNENIKEDIKEEVKKENIELEEKQSRSR